MSEFRLRFPLADIPAWAGRYKNPHLDDAPMRAGDAARARGYLTFDAFIIIARWKSVRPTKRYRENDDATVREVTRFAFGASTDRLRLKALTLLSGISERSASAILHLCHPDPYPLMDVRAFWSAGLDHEPASWLGAWPAYIEFCRRTAAEAGVPLRVLDRAMWAFSDVSGKAALPPVRGEWTYR